MQSARTVRVGVIGVGGMGAFHARSLAATPGVEVVTVADVFEPNARRLADELGCDMSLEPLATAARTDLDGVVVASPDDTHPELAVTAIRAGSMVLCEKPLATDLDDAWRVVEAEGALGRRVVQLGFMREYDPAHTQLLAETETIGRIDFIRLVHRNVNTERRPLDRIIVQSLVHEAHSVRFLSGCEVTEVTAFGGGPENGSYRHVLVRAELSNGGHASLEFDDGGFAYEVAVEVLGRAGDALTGTPLRAVTRRAGVVGRHIGDDWFGWFDDAYRRQDAAWVDSLRTGVAVGPSAWDGYAAQAIVQAAMTSIAETRPVRIDLPARPVLTT
ncbi:MAG: Gfo/Idh/MocA family oxidoreductase [Ilumatobacteraceae bacterium]